MATADIQDMKGDPVAQRNIVADYTLPDVSFWQGWIEDSIAESTEAENLVQLDELFDRALNDCPQIDLVTSLLDNAFHRYEAEIIPEEQVRKICEKCISICGGDITDGAILWRRYIEFEVDECEDVIETSTSEVELKKAKERVLSVFSRQLSLPLAGNQQTLQYLEEVLGNICVESDANWIKPQILQQKYKNSSEMLEARLIYEENLLSDSFLQSSTEDKIAAWKAYIQFEISEKQLSRAQRLYERSLLMCREAVGLWVEYTEFVLNTLKNWSLAESITSRAVRACGSNGNATLWIYRFMAIEAADNPSSMGGLSTLALGGVESPARAASKECAGKFSQAIATALQCVYPDANDYLTILACSSDFRRRSLHALIKAHLMSSHSGNNHGPGEVSEEAQSQLLRDAVVALRTSFDEAETFLQTYYPTWAAAWLQVYKHRCEAEDEAISDALELINPDADSDEDDENDDDDDDDDEAEDHFQGGSKDTKKSSAKASAPASSEAMRSQSAEIWERAVSRFSKNSFIWLEAIQWTRTVSKDFEACRALYRRAMKAVRDAPEEIARSYLQFEQQVGTLSEVFTVMNKVKPILKAAEAAAATAAAAAAATSTMSYSTGYNTSTHSGAGSQGGNKDRNDRKDRKKDTGKKGVTWSNQLSDNSSAPTTAPTVSASGGAKRTYDDEPPTGDTDSSSGAQRSIKRVRISEPSDNNASEQEALSSAPNTMEISAEESQTVPTPAVTNSAPVDHADTTTVFVKNLSFNSTDEEIKAHFIACGEIINVRLVLSKAGKSRGQAYLDFATPQQVAEALKLNESLLAGRPIVVERAETGATGKEPSSFSSSSSSSSGTAAGSGGKSGPGTGPGAAGSSNHHPTTVFVSKFSKELTSAGLKEIFNSCGEILEARVAVDKRSGESKCHGLVQFVHESGKKAALAMNKTTVNGHAISVLPSKFPAVIDHSTATTTGTSTSSTDSTVYGRGVQTHAQQDGFAGRVVGGSHAGEPGGRRKPKLHLGGESDSSTAMDVDVSDTNVAGSAATATSGGEGAPRALQGEKKSISNGSLLQFKPRGLQKPK